MRELGDRKGAKLKQQGFATVAVAAAASVGDVIVLAVPWEAVPETLNALGSLDGKIVVDASNPLTRDLELALGFDDSAGETVARLAPRARVVKAFNTTGSGNMADSRYGGGKLMMAIAGDDVAAKNVVLALATDLGFEAIDAGPLVMSRNIEPLAVLWIRLAYAQKLGTDFGFSLLRRLNIRQF